VIVVVIAFTVAVVVGGIGLSKCSRAFGVGVHALRWADFSSMEYYQMPKDFVPPVGFDRMTIFTRTQHAKP
jgi:hypothetical protein